MRKNRICTRKLCIIPILLICILSGCNDTTQKETQLEESSMEVQQTIENTQATAEQWAKGYGLPVDEKEQEEAETECSEKMELIQDIYNIGTFGINVFVYADEWSFSQIV